MMAAVSVYCNCTCNSLDRLQFFRFPFSSLRFRSSKILHTASYGGGGRGSRLVWRPRVYCKLEVSLQQSLWNFLIESCFIVLNEVVNLKREIMEILIVVHFP